MCSISDDYPEIYKERARVAKKEHKCSECSRLILTGEKYRSAFMVFESHPAAFKTCRHCRVGQQWLLDNCGTFAHGGLMEEMEEHIGEYPDIAFGLYRIKVGMRRRWRSFSGAELLPEQKQAGSIEENFRG